MPAWRAARVAAAGSQAVADDGRRRSLAHLMLSLGILVLIGGLLALGVWQLERRSWKLSLIAQVERRLHAPAVAFPGPDEWRGFVPSDEQYRGVRDSGRYLRDRDTYVQAVTELGPGYWVLTPFRTDSGFTVLINRGFVPRDWPRQETHIADGVFNAHVIVTGLVRLSEPGGGFLRSNDPRHDRWYSRDVTAIAAARGLHDIAPYFVDAAAGIQDWPRGGLTVLAFANHHLVYATTWFALAFLLGAALISVVWRDRWRRWRTS